MNPAYTPGKWYLEGRNVFGDGHVIVATAQWPHVPGEAVAKEARGELDANARLIAAAPELLAALDSMLTHDQAAGPCDVPGLKCECIARAKAAVERAMCSCGAAAYRGLRHNDACGAGGAP